MRDIWTKGTSGNLEVVKSTSNAIHSAGKTENSSGNLEALRSSSGNLHVNTRGAASIDVNNGVIADVEPAVAAATGLVLLGYSCREVAGTPAAAAFNIIHGATVAGGVKTVVVELAANGSETVWFGPDGIAVDSGISIDIVAGAVDVEIFYKTVT